MMDVNITPFFFCVSGSHQVCVLSPSSVFQTPPLFLSILTYFGLPQKQTGKCEQNWFIWRNGVELGVGGRGGQGKGAASRKRSPPRATGFDTPASECPASGRAPGSRGRSFPVLRCSARGPPGSAGTHTGRGQLGSVTPAPFRPVPAPSLSAFCARDRLAHHSPWRWPPLLGHLELSKSHHHPPGFPLEFLRRKVGGRKSPGEGQTVPSLVWTGPRSPPML